MHDPVDDRLGVGAPAHPPVPVDGRVLGAEDGRRAVVPQLRQLQQEVHLVGCRRVDEELVEYQDLVARVLAQDPLLAPSGGELLGAVLEHVGHPDVHQRVHDLQVDLPAHEPVGHRVAVLLEHDVEVKVDRPAVHPGAHLEGHVGQGRQEARFDLVEHRPAAAVALLERGRVELVQLDRDRVVEVR